jgi:hypothetical protein
MIRDLLVEILGEPWVRLLDLASAEQVPSSFTSRGHQRRESDVIWKFRRRDTGDPVYVYILLEFQSKPDRYMPVRMMTYIGLFLEYLIANHQLAKSGKLPLVIPVVIYNGLGPWSSALELSELIERLDPSADPYVQSLRILLVHEAKVPRALLEASQSPVADLFWLERSTTWEEMIERLSRVDDHVGPDEEDLRETFVVWVQKVVLPRILASDEIAPQLTLEEAQTMLAERIDQWNRKIARENLRKGRQEGRQEGRNEGRQEILLRQLETKFGALPKGTRKRVQDAEPELLLAWLDRVLTAESLAEVFSG